MTHDDKINVIEMRKEHATSSITRQQHRTWRTGSAIVLGDFAILLHQGEAEAVRPELGAVLFGLAAADDRERGDAFIRLLPARHVRDQRFTRAAVRIGKQSSVESGGFPKKIPNPGPAAGSPCSGRASRPFRLIRMCLAITPVRPWSDKEETDSQQGERCDRAGGGVRDRDCTAGHGGG
jgi:hypothetical protein